MRTPIFAAVVLSMSAGAALADETCPKKPGFIQGPVVPTKEIAQKIYVAIAEGLYPGKWRKYPELSVVDDGDAWGVGQTSPLPPPQKDGTVWVAAGGGGALEMEIGKCDGAVSMSYAR